MPEYEKLADLDEVPQGTMYEAEHGSEPMIVANVDGEICVFAALCTHLDGPLSQGGIDGGVVSCPWHGSTFDVRSGAALKEPAERPLTTYAVSIEGGEIRVAIP